MTVLFIDIISMILVLFAWFRLYDSMSIEIRVKRFCFLSGIFFALILILDQIWEIVLETFPATVQTDTVLNSITCVIYMLIPVSAAFIPYVYTGVISLRSHLIRILALSFLEIVPFLNIWYKVIFSHREGYMYFKPFFIFYSLVEYLIFLFLIWRYYIRSFLFDRSDHIMVAFSVGIVGVGVLAQIIYGDLTDNWCCISICYLFMILAIDQMYAKTDLVTKLHNREVYLKMLRHHRRENRPLTAVMFDLNHLKDVNDQRGHADGDAYLRAFGLTAQKVMAPYGELFRIGGDEFCMLSITTTPAQLLPVLAELQDREKCDPEYGDFPLDFAFGMAGQRPGEDGEETVHRADQMMYENKRKMHAADRHLDCSI